MRPVKPTAYVASPLRDHLHRLRAGLPPHELRLDLVELVERALLPRGRREHLVHVGRRHAVGEKRDLERGLGRLAQQALARVCLHVPQLGVGVGAVLHLGGIVEQRHAPQHGAGTAGDVPPGMNLSLLDDGPVDLLEDAVFAAAHELGRLDHDHVVGHVAST